LAALLSLDIASSAAASHGAWRTHVPSLRQLRRHLQDCEARRERLANRVRLQRTRPLPPWLGDDLDPDEQVLITAVDEDELMAASRRPRIILDPSSRRCTCERLEDQGRINADRRRRVVGPRCAPALSFWVDVWP
jgi:hypothetical protein